MLVVVVAVLFLVVLVVLVRVLFPPLLQPPRERPTPNPDVCHVVDIDLERACTAGLRL